MGKLITPVPRPASYPVKAAPFYKDTGEVLRRVNPQQPLYLFDQARLVENMQDFQTNFPGIVSYAVKANTRKRVLRALIGQGLTNFDVASITEIKALCLLGGVGVQLHYNNPIKPKADIALAYTVYSVRSFALDDVLELEKILSICTHPELLTLSVRYKLDSHCSAYDFGSKFGADKSSAADLLRRIKHSGALPALTFHPGSQCVQAEEYRRYILAAADIAKQAGVTLAQLNVGGGFPEYYTNTTAQPRQHYFDVIRQAHATAFSKAQPPLMCEPGRAMVAGSTSLLCRVIHVRHTQAVVFINDGIYGGLQEQDLADLRLPLRCWRDGRIMRQASRPYTVFGPTCDPVDRLPRTLELPVDIREGDYLQFALMGAYGSATSTRFNGFDSGDYANVARGWQASPRHC